MSRNEARRQKRLAKRRRKQNEKRLAVRRSQSLGLRGRLQQFSRGRVRDCFLSTSIETEGFGIVFLSREGGRGELAVSVFLVDRYCQGVKDALATVATGAHYPEILERFQDEEVRDVAPETARRLVEDAVEFARGLGLPPHPDYLVACSIFGDLDPHLAQERFEMGREGKPFYISGPDDSPADAQRVVETLHRTCGAGNYDYVCHLGKESPLPDFLDGELLESDAEEWDEGEAPVVFEGEGGEPPQRWWW